MLIHQLTERVCGGNLGLEHDVNEGDGSNEEEEQPTLVLHGLLAAPNVWKR